MDRRTEIGRDKSKGGGKVRVIQESGQTAVGLFTSSMSLFSRCEEQGRKG